MVFWTISNLSLNKSIKKNDVNDIIKKKDQNNYFGAETTQK